MKGILKLLPGLLLAAAPACKHDNRDMATITQQDDFAAPPVAAQKPVEFQEFGHTRVDPWYWLRERDNPEVISYLDAENAYVDTVLGSTKVLQETLYREMLGRIKEDDSSVPVYDNGYYYYSRTEQGKQYAIYCRKKESLEAPEEVLLDGNLLAEGKPAFVMGNYEISPDNRLMAYAVNYTGSFVEFTIRIRDLASGQDLPDEITAGANFVWANDNRTLFYVVVSEALRPYRLFRHGLGASGPDALIYEETDERFNLGISRSKTDAFIFVGSGSFTSTEYRYLPADRPDAELQMFHPRQPDVEYYPEHHTDRFYIYYKDNDHKNYKVMEAPLTDFQDRSTWKDVIAHDPEVRVEGIDVYERYVAVLVRTRGLREIRVLDLANGTLRPLAFPEPVYNLFPGYTPEFSSTKIRYTYTSLNRPSTTYDYDMADGSTVKLKEQEIPSGFNPTTTPWSGSGPPRPTG
jgi:oligopeptidase B